MELMQGRWSLLFNKITVLTQQIFFRNFWDFEKLLKIAFLKIIFELLWSGIFGVLVNSNFREYKKNFENLFNEMIVPLNFKQTSLHPCKHPCTLSKSVLLSFPQRKVLSQKLQKRFELCMSSVPIISTECIVHLLMSKQKNVIRM